MKNIKITISAASTYLPDQSSYESHRFLWSYEITILNESKEIIQLLNRYWRITDMTSHVEEVRGPGVVGLQPIIKPSKPFTYTSFCQLLTPQGTMEGHYEMQTLDEERFVIPIPKFALSTTLSDMWKGKLH